MIIIFESLVAAVEVMKELGHGKL